MIASCVCLHVSTLHYLSSRVNCCLVYRAFVDDRENLLVTVKVVLDVSQCLVEGLCLDRNLRIDVDRLSLLVSNGEAIATATDHRVRRNDWRCCTLVVVEVVGVTEESASGKMPLDVSRVVRPNRVRVSELIENGGRNTIVGVDQSVQVDVQGRACHVIGDFLHE